ncbi:MAG: thiamine phosphate synthase [Holophaga sp.]|nr:thiamine phosphate synthase [Holophaga sp.]
MKGLYLVTDRRLCGDRTLEEIVKKAARGGIAWVQLREKELSTRIFVEEATRIKELLAPLNIPLIINDRVDVALAVGAEGVHVGQSDMPCELVRRLMGPRAIIGLSVETWEDVLRAEKQPVDYLGVSPIFETPTKTDTQFAWGLEGLARIRAFSRHPLVAIGGLNETNIEDAIRAGAEGIAVVSAIFTAADVEQATRHLSQLVCPVPFGIVGELTRLQGSKRALDPSGEEET